MKGTENYVVNATYVYIQIYKILKNSDDKHITKISCTDTALAKYSTYYKQDF